LLWCYRAQPVNNFVTTLLKICCDAVPPNAQLEKKRKSRPRA